jgi:hypothetical protein
MYISLHVKCPLFLSDINDTQISNIMTICSMAAELFHLDVQTDGQTWWNQRNIFTILQKHLKNNFYIFVSLGLFGHITLLLVMTLSESIAQDVLKNGYC